MSGRVAHLSEHNIDGMVFFGRKSNKPKKQKRFAAFSPSSFNFYRKSCHLFSTGKLDDFFWGPSILVTHTHTHHLIYCKGFQGFHFPFPLAVMTSFHKFPGLWVNDFNGEKLHHQGLAFLFAWSPQGARNNKKIYWMRYFFDFFFRTSRTLVFGAMSLCSKILENISDTSGFPNLTFNKCRLHFED